MASIPSRYVVFDTETKETVISAQPRHVALKFWLGVAKVVTDPLSDDSAATYHDLTRPDRLFEILDGLPKTKEKIWIFAHNIGFDLRIVGLFDEISKGRYTLLNPFPSKRSSKPDEPFVVLDDPPTIIRLYRPDGQEIMWLDTWQWLSSSLAKIGQILGNAKGTMPPVDAPLKAWKDYCRQDVDVLDDAMRRIFRWIVDNGYKSFHPTRAGQAKLIFSQKYEHKLIKYHNDPELQAIERPSYYGGFTECFRVGLIQGPVHQLDINSLYPYVMSRYWFPHEVSSASLDGSDTTDAVRQFPRSSIAEVWLNTRDIPYPVRAREGTIFASGKVRTILAGPELATAYASGHVVKTGNFVRYRMAPLFTEFVQDMYESRLKAKAEGNEIFDYFYKLIMNSLYGKFGQMTAEWEFVAESDPKTVYAQGWTIDGDSGESYETRVLAGVSYRRQEQTDHSKSFVSIASFVTAYAREYMRSLRLMLPLNSYYYQATDSLYVSESAYEILQGLKMIDSATLGKFKHESTYDSMNIFNIHNLNKGSIQVRGSIRGKAEKITDTRYRQESWESLLPGIKAGHTREVHIREILKNLEHKYDRQRIDPTGWCSPHQIDNWEIPPSVQAKSWLFRR